jgi:hypothetical protein
MAMTIAEKQPSTEDLSKAVARGMHRYRLLN